MKNGCCELAAQIKGVTACGEAGCSALFAAKHIVAPHSVRVGGNTAPVVSFSDRPGAEGKRAAANQKSPRLRASGSH